MPGTWTYIVDEPRRTELLKALGLPDAVIALGQDSGWPAEAFGFCCRKPVADLDAGREPGDAPVVAIYETDVHESYGVRKREDGLEFVYFSLKKPEDLRVVGRSVQSLLAALFEDIIQSDSYARTELFEAARAVAFERLEDIYDFVLADRKRDVRGYYDRRFAFLQSLGQG